MPNFIYLLLCLFIGTFGGCFFMYYHLMKKAKNYFSTICFNETYISKVLCSFAYVSGYKNITPDVIKKTCNKLNNTND